MTSMVMLESPTGQQIQARAFLDSGSTLSLISNRIVQQLQLRKRTDKLSRTGVCDLTTNSSHSTAVLVKTVDTNQYCLTLTAHILPKVTCNLPFQQAPTVRQLPHIRGLKLADPHFDHPGKIDLLIGGDRLGKLILSKPLKATDSDIVAFETVFGWAIMGPYSLQPSSSSTSTANMSIFTAQMTCLRSSGRQKKPLQHRAILQSVMEHFVSNHSILPEGRFQVTLPSKPDTHLLGESCLQAVKQFQANEASISRRGTWQTFQDIVQEYLDLGHAEPVPQTPSLSDVLHAHACCHQRQQHYDQIKSGL